MGANIIMLTSGKGGTGKTLLSLAIGGSLTARGKNALVIELCGGKRTLDIYSGTYTQAIFDLGDVINGICGVEKAIIKSPNFSNVSLIVAPYEDAVITPEALYEICKEAAQHFDFIILDTAATSDSAFVSAFTVAKEVIIAVTPEIASLRDGRQLADRLRCLSQNNIKLLINKVNAQPYDDNPITDLDFCIDTVTAQLLGVVPFSKSFGIECARGTKPTSTAIYGVFSAIAARLCGEYRPLLINS